MLEYLLPASFLCAAPACSAQEGASPPEAPLSQIASIELPDVEGRLDHLAIDVARERLYVAALGNDSVEVVDLAAGAWLRRLLGPREPQGILYIAEGDRLVVASGGEGTCAVYDGATLESVATVRVGPDADNVRYDARRRQVLVAHGTALGVVDARTWKALDPVPLGGGHPEGFQIDAHGERVYVDVPGARALRVVDLESHTVTATWKLEEAGVNFPMALAPGTPGSDEPDLCLVGCRSPAKLLVRALSDGRALAALELSSDVDDLFYDARRRRVYAACGEGYVDVFERDAEGLGGRKRIATARGARTCLFVPERDRIYVAAPSRGGEPARILVLVVHD